MTDALALPDDLVAWMAETAGGKVTATNRVPGGASREAWFIDVELPGGTTRDLFLRYSRASRGGDSMFHPLRVEAEVFMALQDTEVTVPRTLGVHPTHEAMLAERVPGGTWFYRIKDPAEQLSTAQDFIVNLAALHALDPAALDLSSLGPVKSIKAHVLDEVTNMRRRATGANGDIDPLVRFSLDWLERNVPDYDGPTRLIQGDTGPGNFMYEGGKVTAVVDWELAHFGDPMDDIAWLSLRTVQDTFTHLPDRLSEYEELSGNAIDEARVWYYRLFAETRLSSNRPPRPDADAPPDDAPPVARDIGNGLIYGILHRRLSIEALGAVLGFELEDTELPADAEPEPWHDLYGAVLDNLTLVVPRIEDPLASQWTKGVARVVKYLQELDRNGRAFAADELVDIASVIDQHHDDLPTARAAIAAAVANGKIDDEQYVGYLWRQVQRDDHLLRGASGALRERTWPPLR